MTLSVKRTVALVTLALTIAGCDQIFGETESIRFKASGPVLKEDEAIISARLREHTSTLSPVYSFSTIDGETVMTAKGTQPEASTRFLLAHRGLFQAKSDFGRPWFSQGDIIDAAAGIDEQKRTTLNLRLSAEGTARVARLSANATGVVITAEFDGEKLTTARVSGPITQGQIQLTVNRTPNETLLISTILNTGALSFAAEAIQQRAQK